MAAKAPKSKSVAKRVVRPQEHGGCASPQGPVSKRRFVIVAARPIRAKENNGLPRRRRQQRAIDTRLAILKAALAEFSENGFEATSLRLIGVRTGLPHQLIGYHFGGKKVLWQAVAGHALDRVKHFMDVPIAAGSLMAPLEGVREVYVAFLRFTLEYPDFHRFMVRENQPGNPRLGWITKNFTLPAMESVLPLIQRAQTAGQLPSTVSAALIHYMMVGMMSVTSSLSGEIEAATGMRTQDPDVFNAYLRLVDAIIFRQKPTPVPK